VRSCANFAQRTIDSPVTHSMPTRTEGAGSGKINIKILSEVETKGYKIFFESNTICRLESNGILIDRKTIDQSQWILTDPNKIQITIKNNTNNPYLSVDELYFSTLNDSILFNLIKIE